MALFKKLISAVKKLFRKPSSRRKSRKGSPHRGKIRFPKRKIFVKKKPKKNEKKAPAARKTKITGSRAKPKKPKLSPASVSLGKPQPSEPAGVLVGVVTHYFSKIMVVVVKMTQGTLTVGNRVRIKGRTNDFTQKVSSLQIESRDVKIAPKGQLVGLKVVRPVKPGDRVFKLP